MPSKSYWSGVLINEAALSWFGPFNEDITFSKIEMLCDKETDKIKKLRAFAFDNNGNKYKLERTMSKYFSISRKRI